MEAAVIYSVFIYVIAGFAYFEADCPVSQYSS